MVRVAAVPATDVGSGTRVTTTVSSPPTRASSIGVTVTNTSDWPAADMTRPLRGWKSVPEVAVPVTVKPRVSGCDVSPVRLDRRVPGEVGSAAAATVSTDTTGGSLSSMMVRVTGDGTPIVPPLVASVRATTSVSFPSDRVSSAIVRKTAAVSCPSRKVTVVSNAGEAVKSSPAVAVPPVSRTVTVRAPEVPPVRLMKRVVAGPGAAPSEIVGEMAKMRAVPVGASPTVRPDAPASPGPAGPTSVAAPVRRSMAYSPVAPPTVRRASPRPTAGSAGPLARMPAGMSNPPTAVKSSGAPLRVTGSPAVCVPMFGGVWMNSMSPAASRVNWAVTPPAGWPKLFV